MAERWQRLEVLFERAVRFRGAERAAFLSRACPDDPALRWEAASLAAAEDRAAGFLTSDDPFSARSVPTRIGPYRVLRRIGGGATSQVFLAVGGGGDADVGRVAIKVLRAGLESPDLLRRFRIERQVLARLDHPAIARLRGSGMTDGGVPFLVIEHVDGLPIDRHCDRRRLTVDRRLALVMRVCDAVAHAHRRGVVHRDLKPGNILVTPDGRPKLLDFGIAKLLDPLLAARAGPPTATWMRALTPGYASPELIRHGTATPASDVYALGVVLFQLLVGRLPGAPAGDLGAALDAAERTSAVRASRAVVGLDGAALDARATDRRDLERRLRGDLDAVIQRALERSPGARYGSAEALAADLGRHLAGQPTLAAAPRRWRLARAVARQRAVAAGALVALGAALTLFADRRPGTPAAGVPAVPATSRVAPSVGWCVPDGGLDDTLARTDCCSGVAVSGSTVCLDERDWGRSWRSCVQLCGSRLQASCVPGGGVDDTLDRTDCCSGRAVPGSTRCLDPADFGGSWRTCVQTCA